MGNKLCGSKKNLKKIHNSAYDLVDSDGDYIISKNELKNLSKLLLEIHIKREQERLSRLTSLESNKYIYDFLDLKEGSNITKKKFSKLAYSVSPTVWEEVILPELRQAEIKRLINEK